MKEEWKVFIRGVEDCGNEVLKILEEHGGNNLNGWSGGGIKAIYFIGHQGNIQCVDDWCEFGKIIMDNYKEIKLPQQWKDGDVLVSNDDDCYFAVFQKLSERKGMFITLFTLQRIGKDDANLEYSAVELTKDFHLATEADVERMEELLQKRGLEWDLKTQQLIYFRWRPKLTEEYWYITTTGKVSKSDYIPTSVDVNRVNFGNRFQTEDDANEFVSLISALFKASDEVLTRIKELLEK